MIKLCHSADGEATKRTSHSLTHTLTHLHARSLPLHLLCHSYIHSVTLPTTHASNYSSVLMPRSLITHLPTLLLFRSSTHHLSHSPTDSYASTLSHPLTGQPNCPFLRHHIDVIINISVPCVLTGIKRGFHCMLGQSLLDKRSGTRSLLYI